MAKFSNLTAPTTNQAAANRLADTQAIRARAAVGAAPTGTPVAQAAQSTGAALTQQAGQQSLQQQGQQAGIAKAQAQNVLQDQRLGQQQSLIKQESNLQDRGLKLDQQLFDVSEAAANEENRLRNSFNDRVARDNYLQEMDLLTWAVQKAESGQDFKDKVQSIQQAHDRKFTMVQHAYKVVMQAKEQEFEKASGERKQQLRMEIAQIKKAAAEERAKAKAEAANRSAMAGAFSTIVSVGVGAALASNPATVAFAPVAMAGTKGLLDGSGASEQAGKELA